MLQNPHSAGTKSYARWSKDLVSQFVLFKIHLYMFTLLSYITFHFQRQDDPNKKQPHRAMVYLATHKKKDKDKNQHVVCHIHIILP